PAVRREPGLRTDAGVVPAAHRGGARRDPRRRRRNRRARSPDARPLVSAQAMTATVEPATTPGPDPPLAEARRGFGADLWRAVARNRYAPAGVVRAVFFPLLPVLPGQSRPPQSPAGSSPPGPGSSPAPRSWRTGPRHDDLVQ